MVGGRGRHDVAACVPLDRPEHERGAEEEFAVAAVAEPVLQERLERGLGEGTVDVRDVGGDELRHPTRGPAGGRRRVGDAACPDEGDAFPVAHVFDAGLLLEVVPAVPGELLGGRVRPGEAGRVAVDLAVVEHRLQLPGLDLAEAGTFCVDVPDDEHLRGRRRTGSCGGGHVADTTGRRECSGGGGGDDDGFTGFGDPDEVADTEDVGGDAQSRGGAGRGRRERGEARHPAVLEPLNLRGGRLSGLQLLRENR